MHCGPAPVPAGPHDRRRMDFVRDAPADGSQFRGFIVVDQWSPQSPLLEVRTTLSISCRHDSGNREGQLDTNIDSQLGFREVSIPEAPSDRSLDLQA